MRKTFLALMLLAALTLQAQSTSRILLGLGGGLSSGTSEGRMENIVGPMGSFNFGYAIFGPRRSEVMVGFRTGLHLTCSQIGMKAVLNEQFSNVDYYGHQLDYTVTGNVNFRQKQFNLEIPLMFTLDGKGVVFSLGTKLIANATNKYTQTITDPVVAAYYGDYGVTVINDVATGIITDDQANMTGKAKMPALMFSISAEIGYLWNLKGNHRLGFDFFVDYVPGGVGANKDNQHQIVEIDPIVKDQFQPKAPVTVNPMVTCNNFKYQYVNAGVKLVWAFDIKNKK